MQIKRMNTVRRSRPLVALTALGALALFWMHSARAIVTSDGHGTHVTTPGEPAFGVNVDGVVQLGFQGIEDGFCTGSLISDRHVLTAGHCIDRLGDAFLLSNSQVRFDLVGGSRTIAVSGVVLHPLWTGDIDTGGHDISVLELADPAPDVAPRYDIFTGTNEVGRTFVKVGYGTTGFGATGGDTFDNLKRAGLNLYDATAYDGLTLAGLPPAPVAMDILAYDFDNGLAANDTFGALGLPDLGFGIDEVNGAPGDSGGPTFFLDDGIYKIAGVASLGSPVSHITGTDVDAIPRNASWGEVSADTRVSSFILFIQDVVAGRLDPIRAVILVDGRAHTVDTHGNDLFFVSDGPDSTRTTLHLTETGSLGAVRYRAIEAEFNSLVNISGGSVDGDVALTHSAAFTMTAGAVNGGLSDSGNFVAGADSAVIITGGSVSADSVGLELGGRFNAFPSTSVAFIENATVRGGRTGVVAGGASAVIIPNGAIEGGRSGEFEERGIEVGGTARVSILDGTIDGSSGVFTFGNAAAHIAGGAVTGVVVGVLAQGDSAVQVEGGMIQGGRSGDNPQEHGIVARGQAAVGISGGTVDGTRGVLALENASIRLSDGHVAGIVDGVLVRDSASMEMLSGSIASGPNGDSEEQGIRAFGQARVGIVDGMIDGMFGIFASQDAAIDMSGGRVTGRVVGVIVRDSVTLAMLGGSIAGGLSGDSQEQGVRAFGQSRVNITDGIVDGTFGIFASQAAAVDISGGSITGIVDGLNLADDATALIQGGAIAGGQSGDVAEDGIEAGGRTQLTVSGGTIAGTFGVSVINDASVLISGGDITGIVDGVYADGNASIEILGGSIGGVDFAGIDAYGNATVAIVDGVIRGDVGVYADEAATIDVFGGAIQGVSVDLEVFGPDARIRIFGQRFSELPGPLCAKTGSVSGRFADGTAFDFTFNRVEGGTIILVPVRDTFISPLGEDMPMTDFEIELSHAATLVGSTIEVTGGTAPTGVTLTDGGTGPNGGVLHTVRLTGAAPVGQWTKLTLDVARDAGCDGSLTLFVAHQPLDFNRDGITNIRDATAFGEAFGGAQNPLLIDLNNDGVVDTRDATAFGNIWNGLPPATQAWRNTSLPARP